MLILYHLLVNTLNQNSYDDTVHQFDLAIRHAVCPSCKKSRGMIGHGSYKRKFRSPDSPDSPVQINIHRCRCKGCGATHAVFLLMMLPFFRITLPDACSFLSAPDKSGRERIAVNLSMDDDSIRFLSNRYRSDWKNKLSFSFRLSCTELAVICFSSFRMWFLQKTGMKRKICISVLPTYPSCIRASLPLII